MMYEIEFCLTVGSLYTFSNSSLNNGKLHRFRYPHIYQTGSGLIFAQNEQLPNN